MCQDCCALFRDLHIRFGIINKMAEDVFGKRKYGASFSRIGENCDGDDRSGKQTRPPK